MTAMIAVGSRSNRRDAQLSGSTISYLVEIVDTCVRKGCWWDDCADYVAVVV